ncbi:MAG TPA: hypothetical protein VF669_17630, partial [Tepidisphaeraceae bacterium]
MKDVVVGQGGGGLSGADAGSRAGAGAARVGRGFVRKHAASFWLGMLFFLARRAPAMLRWGKPLGVFFAAKCSHVIQDATGKNARRIYGSISEKQRRQFTWRVTEHFYDFVADVGRAMTWTREQMLEQVVAVEGKEHYDAARALKRGAIVATAHMGSFEVGLASLVSMEKNVHVVFRRDAEDPFEGIRNVVRQRLGVNESPVDEGWGLWVRLRDALLRDEVVVIQGDRVMPGQKGQRVEFLGNHIMLPTGPAKLARAS